MDKLFSNYSITEISQKTHISPIILEKLKNEDFSTVSKIKLYGFIKILEDEYPEYDFSKLKNSVDEYFDTSKEDIAEIAAESKEKESKKIYFIVILLLLFIAGLIFVLNNKSNKNISHVIEKNITTKQDKNKTIDNIDNNKTQIKSEEKVVESNTTKQTKMIIKPIVTVTKEENLTLVIIPLKKVWFKVTYLDNLKSKEYLTSHEVDLNGSRPLFIKFGHGFVKLKYKNQTVEPNDKHITRVILEDEELNITKKRIKEFK